MTCQIIRLADRSPTIRERQLVAHQAELLLAPYRFAGAITCAAAAAAWAVVLFLVWLVQR